MKTKELQAGDFVTKAVRLLHPLAEGGMGRVWVAEHLGLDTNVVVKLMSPQMAERSDGAERFAREAAIAAAIKTPHVAQVFDHGVTPEGTPYIVMELLEGKDLGAHLEVNGRMDPADVVALVTQTGKALSKAHRAQIIHRDIKPENIFLCDTDGGEIFVKLLDFGTARRETEKRSRTTVPGQIMGTPHYMSPEQSVGCDIDERSDIWSLGVVVFEALTGQKPFDGASVGAITIAIHGPLPRMTDVVRELPLTLDAWFERCCAHEPRERFPNIREATHALVEAVTGAPPAELLTESIHFPTAASMAITSSAPVAPSNAPVASSIAPLAATLPKHGSRTTKIAMGVVGAVSAIAMGAILFGRSPAPLEVKATQPVAARPAPPPAAEAPPPPAPEEAKPEVAAAPPPPAEPVAAPPPKPVQTSVARVPRPKPTTASPRGAKGPRGAAPSPSEGLDDDLVRLSNAAAKHAEPAAPPAPTTPAAPPPLPAPVSE
jgi:serine/threonine protein kinase